MKVTPVTAKQAEAMGLIPRSLQDFEVLTADEETSKSGNEMLKVKLGIEHDGRTRWVTDYLVATEGMAYKVRHFAESIGLLAEYEAGDLHAADVRGRAGRCRVGIEPAKDDFPAKNKIIDYVPMGTAMKAAAGAASTSDLVDDEIPF